jgi:hypothetical protein
LRRRNLIWFMIAWLGIMLFPIGYVSQLNPKTHFWFEHYFKPEWVHVVAHLLIFAVLTGVVWNLLGRPNVLWMPVLVLGVGWVQEIIQLYFKHKIFGWPEIFDLLVDLTGGTIGLLVTAWLVRRRAITPGSHEVTRP